jgi:hypothetical protein
MIPIDVIEKRIWILALGILISACGLGTVPPTPEIQVTDTAINSPVPTATDTSLPPTPTPILLAVIINGEEITLREYESELHRFQSALADYANLQNESGTQVLEDIINQVLLAQGAVENGYIQDEEILNERMNELAAALGGPQQFDLWLQENGYTQQDFLQILERSIMGAWMRDLIVSEVPKSADQVHAYQILLYNSEQANQVLAELESGREFATLAAVYAPITKGNIGWFPINFLPHPEIEEVAFNLQPGEYSQVIETSVGYHIIQVVDRDQDRLLSPEARLIWQENALQEWVQGKREQSQIVILIPQEGE